MHKSQLRKLAQQYARAELEEAEYRRLRIELIDSIVDERIPIVREPPPKPVPPPSAPPREDPEPVRRSLAPIYVVVGVVVIGLVAWFGFASKPEPPRSVSTVGQSTVARSPGPGERLIEEFLTQIQWSEARLSGFKTGWSALSELERAQARDSSAYQKLSTAIGQEISAQQALAQLDGSGENRPAVERAHGFGRYLGMEDSLPKLAPASASTEAAQVSESVSTYAEPEPIPEALASVETQSEEAVLPADAIAEGQPEPAINSGATAATTMSLHGKWLSAQQRDHYSLQLFVMNSDENVESLLNRYPDLNLKVHLSSNQSSRFRILYGVFETEADAHRAFQTLPADITKDVANPVARSIATLQDSALALVP